MLNGIRLSNFKAFGETESVPLGRITLIFGPNSAGKSSIIQSILLMRQSLQGSIAQEKRLLFSGDDVNLGTYSSALFQHNRKNPMALGYSFSYERNRGITRRSSIPRNGTRSIDIDLDLVSKSANAQNDEAWVTGVKFALNEADIGSVQLIRSPTNTKPQNTPDATIGEAGRFQLKDNESASNLVKLLLQGNAPRIESMDRRFREDGKPKEVATKELIRAVKKIKFFDYGLIPSRGDYRSLSEKPGELMPVAELLLSPYNPLESFRDEFVGELTSVSYLGPLRSPPARHYIISGSDRATVGSTGESMPHILYRRKRDMLPRINEKLKEFGIPYRIDVANVGNQLTGEIIAIALSDRNDVTLSPSDVGFGIGQLLPILVEGLVSYKRVICVEQPEIHLHPRLAAHLADFLIETAISQVSAARATGRPSAARQYGGNQWIVETHSEALMLRLQTLIKKKIVPVDFVSVLYVEPVEGKGSRVVRLRLDEDGDFIDEWPDGFFEESFKEMFFFRR